MIFPVVSNNKKKMSSVQPIDLSDYGLYSKFTAQNLKCTYREYFYEYYEMRLRVSRFLHANPQLQKYFIGRLNEIYPDTFPDKSTEKSYFDWFAVNILCERPGRIKFFHTAFNEAQYTTNEGRYFIRLAEEYRKKMVSMYSNRLLFESIIYLFCKSNPEHRGDLYTPLEVLDDSLDDKIAVRYKCRQRAIKDGMNAEFIQSLDINIE